MIDQCKAEDVIACPYCHGERVDLWGMASGLQRYRCKNEKCTKTFNALTKTPLSRLRKKELWLKQTARDLGVAETTVFRCRHRFLAAPTLNKISEVTGIVEADEMFFLETIKVSELLIDLAKELIARFHDEAAAQAAHDEFINRFQKGALPDDMPEMEITA